MLYNNLGINEIGHLTFCGLDTTELAKEYKTPLYLMDENGVRDRCREYKTASDRAFPEGSLPLYASKALSFLEMYRIINEEGLGADVSSSGELYTAYKAGFPMEKVYFHGNNKTEDDIAFGMELKTGCFICDNAWELESIDRIAGEKGVVQKVILRLTPGIDPHTLEAINTGRVDSKFGVAIETGQAEEYLKDALSRKNISVIGYHCHIGSQIFEAESFEGAVEKMVAFSAEMRDKYGYVPEYIDIGGGMGVPYTEEDEKIDYGSEIDRLGEIMTACCGKHGLTVPKVLLEPGRSIVADKGITLYTVGGRKEIPGFKNYIAIDGGMTDNPRYALYGAKHSVYNASRPRDKADYMCTVAGRCCESGDLIREDILLPKPERGDILAVLTTGAYNYSMASNYNRIARPPVVMIKDGVCRIAVKRESLDDLLINDI